MAKSIVYSMKQYRTKEITNEADNIYSPKCDISIDYTDTSISDDSTTLKGYSFKDPYIKLVRERTATSAGITTEVDSSGKGRIYQKNKVYYLRLSIPRNRIYDCEYNLKLYNEDKSEYQLIKNISIAKNLSESSIFTHDVVLFQPYEDDDGSHIGYEKTDTYNDGKNAGPLLIGRIALYGGVVPATWEFITNSESLVGQEDQNPSGGILTKPFLAADYTGELVYLTTVAKEYDNIARSDENYTSTDRIYFYSNGKKWIQVSKYSYANIETSWNSNSIPTENIIIETIFSPKGDNFNILSIEMVRNIEDYNISYIKDSSKYYGRDLQITADDCELRTITNIISTLVDIQTETIDANGNSSIGHGSFSRVGVWGHSNALTAIESEEFRVGPNGYYEVYIDGGDYNIEKFGVVVRDFYDKFFIDYEYPRTISYAEDSD